MDPSTVTQAASAAPSNLVAILGVMIPIVAIVMGLGIGMLKLWLDFRKKREILQAHHTERMAAIEKGIDLPPLPPQVYGLDGESASGNPAADSHKTLVGSGNLRSGLTWLLIGLAITIALYADSDNAAAHGAAWWGLVPAAFGLSRLLFYFMTSRAAGRVDARGDQSKPN